MFRPIFGLAAALFAGVCAPVFAAPAEQADCPYAKLAVQDRVVAGEVLFAVQANMEPNFDRVAVKQAQSAIEKAMQLCIAENGWTQDEALAAFSYVSTRMLADTARLYLLHKRGDADVADLFFAQNKYRIMDEAAAGNSSEQWANTRLVEMGFAKAGSPAFQAVWLYLDFLFQIEIEREAFAIGGGNQKQ